MKAFFQIIGIIILSFMVVAGFYFYLSLPDVSGLKIKNPRSTSLMVQRYREAKKTDQITLIAFDGQLEGKQAIKDGKIYADPIQFPAKMGAVSVQNIAKYLNGEEFNTHELIPTEIRTPSS